MLGSYDEAIRQLAAAREVAYGEEGQRCMPALYADCLTRLPASALSNPCRSRPRLDPLASPLRAFRVGVSAVASTVLALVLFATYLGIGALAHDTHFSWAGYAGKHGC